MNVLHYLNVLIGFSLVMLLLSITISFAVQSCLVLLKIKAREVGDGLTSMLEDIGLEKSFARLNVNELLDKDELLDKGNSIFGDRLGSIKDRLGRVLSKVSAFIVPGAPKNIGREEFILLLLRKARSDKDLAKDLGFQDETDASVKLKELEMKMLEEETKNPTLQAQVWRTNAMQNTVPELASKVFARFDDVIDRVTENVSTTGKFLGLIIALPLLLIYWPVDSIGLFNRLNNDQVFSEKLAAIAEANVPTIEVAQKDILECMKNNPDNGQVCAGQKQALENIANTMVSNLSKDSGLFGKNLDEHNSKACSYLFEGCRIAKPTPGIVVTWILVSLGSAFWIGVLNKMLGIRSEFNKKLDAQRESRATSQE